MFRTIVLLLFAAAFVALLVACGGGTDSISVTVTDFQFEPDNWTVSAGSEVTSTLANNRAEDHQWVLLGLGALVTAPFDEDDEDMVLWRIEAEPGEIESETFVAPAEPGVYGVVCGNTGHFERGMQATLTVE